MKASVILTSTSIVCASHVVSAINGVNLLYANIYVQ